MKKYKVILLAMLLITTSIMPTYGNLISTGATDILEPLQILPFYDLFASNIGLQNRSNIAREQEQLEKQKEKELELEKQKKFEEDIAAIYEKVKKKYNLDYNYIGLYVEQLNTEYTWKINNDLVYDPTTDKTKGKFSVASAVKLPMAFSTLRYMEENDMLLKETFTDSLSGHVLTLGEVTGKMVSNSINKNFNYLLRYMGQSKTNEYLEKYGIKNSTVNAELGGADPYWSSSRVRREYGTLNNSRFTPEDYGLILKQVYKGVQDENEYMEFLNQALLDNIYSTRIPQGINYKYPVAHKTGTYSKKGKFADVGIVYLPENPYIIVLNLDNQRGKYGCQTFMREFSYEVNKYMESLLE